TGSYRRSVAAATTTLVRVMLGVDADALLTDAPTPLVTHDEIIRFKLAGGFNNDWDLTQALTALWVARVREWRDQPQAQITLTEWAARARVAAHTGQGGVRWLYEVAPASAIPHADDARWVHEEYYWGAELAQQHFGHTPRFAPDARGYVHAEQPLLDAAVLPGLARQGITRFGLITGRDGPEISSALRILTPVSGLRDGADSPDGGATGVTLPWYDSPYGRSPFGALVPASVYVKPDPRALASAMQQLGAQAALFVGDAGDDLLLVLRYRRELQRKTPGQPTALAVMIASAAAARAYQDEGADITLDHIRDLPAAMVTLAALAHV
ncbi:MAG TPA: hypothetical protein VKQ36_03560, partial [Ktedonobacterales bacterium]|nr:hypothetical protein [Ktedonobacterales bacterium]